jgi:hypothetical protein
MPGRRDYSIIWARAITDARILRAAELYAEARIAKEDTAHAAVLGHVAMLGLWCSRETDDGSLPGNGIAAVRAATMSTPRIARAILDVMTHPEVDLITRGPEPEPSLRLRGVREAYEPLFKKREGNRSRAQKARSNADVTRDVTRDVGVTCGTRGPERRGEESRDTPQPPAGAGGTTGGIEASPSRSTTKAPLTSADADVFRAIIRRCRTTNLGTLEQRARVVRLSDEMRAGRLDPDDARAIIDELQCASPEMTSEAQNIRRIERMTENARAG